MRERDRVDLVTIPLEYSRIGARCDVLELDGIVARRRYEHLRVVREHNRAGREAISLEYSRIVAYYNVLELDGLVARR